LHYFLEENIHSNRDIKEKNDPKNKSCLNLGNLEEVKPECEAEEKELIDHSDEETALLQIPQNINIETYSRLECAAITTRKSV